MQTLIPRTRSWHDRRPKNDKEVAHMFSIKLPMTAQIPSGFAMPATGAISGTGLGTAETTGAVCTATTFAVRDRHVAGIAVAQAYRPGSTAWSPPTC
jgi:hypothetical protein